MVTLGQSSSIVPLVNTAGLVYYLFDLAETARIDAKSNLAVAHLKKCSLIAVGRLNQDGGGFCYLSDDRRLQIQGSGVADLKSFMVNDGIHRNVLAAFEKLWADMRSESIIASGFEAASFIDLTVFLAKCIKFRRSKKTHSLSQHGAAFRDLLRNAVVKLLASSVDVVVMQAQLSSDIYDRQIPSRGRRKKRTSSNGALVVADEEDAELEQSEPRKGRVKVDLNTIWEMHEHSNQIGISLPAYLQTKEHDGYGGCHAQTCQMWLRKIYAMYSSRASLGFRDADNYNIITDASRFSGKETLISVAYSPENDVAVYLPNQFLRSGKNIGPDDVLLEGTLESLVAQRKAQRTSAYALLEALNNQLKQLSQGKVTISTFDLENTEIGRATSPLSPNDLRVVTRDRNDAVNVFIQDKTTGDSRRIDLSGVDNVRTLCIGMDQGTSGMSMASFLTGTNNKSMHAIHFNWDPFHRCARDMRLSMAMRTIPSIDVRSKVKQNLQAAHLASTFLFSLNYKPFGSGGFSQNKMELLQFFIGLEDEDWTLMIS